MGSLFSFKLTGTLLSSPHLDDKPTDDKDIENIVALDEGDIALLKTYVGDPFCHSCSKRPFVVVFISY